MKMDAWKLPAAHGLKSLALLGVQARSTLSGFTQVCLPGTWSDSFPTSPFLLETIFIPSQISPPFLPSWWYCRLWMPCVYALLVSIAVSCFPSKSPRCTCSLSSVSTFSPLPLICHCLRVSDWLVLSFCIEIPLSRHLRRLSIIVLFHLIPK